MRTRRRATIEDLRRAIDCLPLRTREAMLHGIDANTIIVGAYTSGEGICPMLAAHRAGGRTSLIAFADAWDQLAFRGARKAKARRATERELLILKSHLEASLLDDDAPTGALAAARREHHELLARRAERPTSERPTPERPTSERPTSERPTPERLTPDRPTPDRPSPKRLTSDRPTERPGDPDRTQALGDRPGWAWTRVVRRYDDYERLLRRVEAARRHAADAEPGACIRR